MKSAELLQPDEDQDHRETCSGQIELSAFVAHVHQFEQHWSGKVLTRMSVCHVNERCKVCKLPVVVRQYVSAFYVRINQTQFETFLALHTKKDSLAILGEDLQQYVCFRISD